MSGTFTLSEDQLKKIYEAFTKGDKDADGKISWKEFSQISEDFRLGLDENQIREIFKRGDNDRRGYLTLAKVFATCISMTEQKRVKASPMPSIAALDENKLKEVRTYFYDKEPNKGKLTRMECLFMLWDIGIRMSNDDISFIFKFADDDNDSMISYEEFKTLARGQTWRREKKLQQKNFIVRERFLHCDSDGDEKLNRLEFQELLKLLHMPIDKRSLATVFRDVDTNRDGKISWDEFYDVYQKSQATPEKSGGAATAVGASSPFSSHSSSYLSDRPSSCHSISHSSSDSSEQISRKDIIRACNYFWSADKNGDGQLSRLEFGNMVQALKLKMTEEEIDKAFRKSDRDHNKTISFAEFADNFLNRKSKHQLSHEDMKQTFLQGDKKKKGYLTVQETRIALKLMGCNLDEDQITSIIANIDDNHDGKITLSEFCVFLDIGE